MTHRIADVQKRNYQRALISHHRKSCAVLYEILSYIAKAQNGAVGAHIQDRFGGGQWGESRGASSQ